MAKALLSKNEVNRETGAISKAAPPYIAPPPPPPPLPSRTSSAQLLQRLQRAETEASRGWALHAQAVQEIQRVQTSLQQQSQELQRARDEAQDLRDLCCFLDDERQKGRKLAREWQRFGRYTAAVMRQEVACYQGKLATLEERQERLVKENVELKELCLYLDEERQDPCPTCGHRLSQRQSDSKPLVISAVPVGRGDADGSSTGTVGTEETSFQKEEKERKRSLINEQVLDYVRNLERRLANLEGSCKTNPIRIHADSDPRRPKTVSQALQVLEVCQRIEDTTESLTDSELEGDSHHPPSLPPHPPPTGTPNSTSSTAISHQGSNSGTALGQGERALVRHFCNVVWKKLEEGTAS